MKFIVTAGPTREHIDPVRFLSNPSTGRMGFEIARSAIKAGCETVLIAGPVSLKTPLGARRIDVVSARDMLDAVLSELKSAEGTSAAIVMSAAVADWRPRETASRKLKKGEMSPVLQLERNPDILKTIEAKVAAGELDASRLARVGFAAETGDFEDEARRKCREKGLDAIVANDVSRPGCGFGTGTNMASMFFADGSRRDFAMMSKRALAGRIVRCAVSMARGKETQCQE